MVHHIYITVQISTTSFTLYNKICLFHTVYFLILSVLSRELLWPQGPQRTAGAADLFFISDEAKPLQPLQLRWCLQPLRPLQSLRSVWTTQQI